MYPGALCGVTEPGGTIVLFGGTEAESQGIFGVSEPEG